MTYIVYQTIRGKKYAYEAEGYWDPEKKQARQRRKYLGAVDEETGEIIPKTSERSVATTKAYGHAYLFSKLIEESGLDKKLKSALKDDGASALALAMAKVIDFTSMRLVHHLMEDTAIAEASKASASFTSQNISDILVRLARDQEGMKRFYASLIQYDEEVLIYDITSVGSQSKGINWLEYGDDYRKLKLPQVNLGLVVNIDRKIPLYCKLYPGSINDVSTLRNLVAEVRDLGVKEALFVLDRGFYSAANVEELLEQHIDFVMPVPFSNGIGTGAVEENVAELMSSQNAKRFGKDIYHVLEKDVFIADRKVRAYVMFNKKREGEEYASFFNRLMDIETALEGARPKKGRLQKKLEEVAAEQARYFILSEVDGRIHLERNQTAIAEAMAYFGRMVLISPAPLKWDDALAIYKERDLVEKFYDQLKNDLDFDTLRVHRDETLQGMAFVFFLALALRALLKEKARAAGLLEKSSLEDILRELSKIRAVQIGQTWTLSEIGAKQRTMLQKMGIAVPLRAGLVIKKGGV